MKLNVYKTRVFTPNKGGGGYSWSTEYSYFINGKNYNYTIGERYSNLSQLKKSLGIIGYNEITIIKLPSRKGNLYY